MWNLSKSKLAVLLLSIFAAPFIVMSLVQAANWFLKSRRQLQIALDIRDSGQSQTLEQSQLQYSEALHLPGWTCEKIERRSATGCTDTHHRKITRIQYANTSLTCLIALMPHPETLLDRRTPRPKVNCLPYYDAGIRAFPDLIFDGRFDSRGSPESGAQAWQIVFNIFMEMPCEVAYYPLASDHIAVFASDVAGKQQASFINSRGQVITLRFADPHPADELVAAYAIDFSEDSEPTTEEMISTGRRPSHNSR